MFLELRKKRMQRSCNVIGSIWIVSEGKTSLPLFLIDKKIIKIGLRRKIAVCKLLLLRTP